jgi:hypothetical protein
MTSHDRHVRYARMLLQRYVSTSKLKPPRRAYA